jgi:hypothetical protein
MAKLFKKIKQVDKLIQEKKSELSTTLDPFNGYFLMIGTETERKENIDEINMELRILYSNKFSLLESLERQIHFEKVNISNIERELSLSINHRV